MLREYASILRRLMVLADLAILLASFLLAYYIRNSIDSLNPLSDYGWPLLVLVVIWCACLYFSGMYTSFRLKKTAEVIFIIYQAVYIGLFLFAGACYIFHIESVSRALVLLTFIFSAGITTLEKIAMVFILRKLRRKGFNYRNVIVVGTGSRAQHLIRQLTDNREMGMQILCILDDEKERVGQVIEGYPVAGTLADLPRIVRENVVDQAFFIVPRSWLDQVEESILFLEKLGIRVDVAIDHFNLVFARAKQTDLFGIPFLSFEMTPDHAVPLLLKRIMDVVVSGVALIILAPFFVIFAVLIKLTSPGPVFFIQKRVSLNGRIFNLFKFRTMVKDAEAKLAELQHLNEMEGPVFKIDKDPRITPVGSFFRKSSIDELPQFWNVFRGDMSLVGPRPPIPKEVAEYDDWQRRRISMRPGITCLWQVQGRNKITDFNEWAALDLQYIDNWSLWLDIRILLKTIPVVLFRVGSK